jgi:hypothetical protein
MDGYSEGVYQQSGRSASRRITNLKTSESALWRAIEPYAAQLIDEDRARRAAARSPGAPPLPPKVPRRDDLFLHRIFLSYREITDSFDTLNSIPVFLAHFPSSLPRRISRLAWVRYHVENYFHELYVFQNRTEAFFKQLRRAYRAQQYATALEASCNSLEIALRDAFVGVVAARGQHVHERRFDDTSLRMLGMIELLVAAGGRPRRDRTYSSKTPEWTSGFG